MRRSDPSYPSKIVGESSMKSRPTTRRDFVQAAAAGLGILHSAPLAARGSEPVLVSVEKIWDRAEYNSFTDLVRFQDRWYCTFREGVSHEGDIGVVRVLVSDDAEKMAINGFGRRIGYRPSRPQALRHARWPPHVGDGRLCL